MNPCLGQWRIVDMDQWDQDYVDMESAGTVTFVKGGAGQFHFGCVEAELDWRADDDADRIAFTFAGFDEGDEISGRGWAKAEGTTLTGRIVIHQGDESGFQATKQLTRARPTKSHRR